MNLKKSFWWIYLGWCFPSICRYKGWPPKYLLPKRQFSNAGKSFRQSEEGKALNIKHTVTLEVLDTLEGN